MLMHNGKRRQNDKEHPHKTGDATHKYRTRRARIIARVTSDIKRLDSISTHIGRQKMSKTNAHQVEVDQACEVHLNALGKNKAAPPIGTKDQAKYSSCQSQQQKGVMYLNKSPP